MRTQERAAAIKTRVPEDVKAKMVEIARTKDVDLSDIAREAFREYLAKHAIQGAPAINVPEPEGAPA